MFSYLYIIYFFIVIIYASSYFSKCPEEDSLRECLDQYHIQGPINFRDNVIAYNNEIDVQSAAKCAIKLNFPITARSGGHSVRTENTLGSLYKELQQYTFAFSAGIDVKVGVDILDAQIVLANGTVVYNVKKYPELLWAIRGAENAGYGIIISLTLRVYPIQKIITWIHLEYNFDQLPTIFSVITQLGSNLYRNIKCL
ncbi:FAD-binding protein [Gigaspora margarita]|uniref:FAD-binding protein n=1 Tax=Gigaspora margarita TaxID=4874 RepID=A0A8H4ALD6_GIGMA|nr:FAD-binding protein [Gigaspora margarita]